jgi:hypothetical protein
MVVGLYEVIQFVGERLMVECLEKEFDQLV